MSIFMTQELTFSLKDISQVTEANVTLTCDQAFFFSGSAKVWQRESWRSGEERKKRTPDTITARVVCRPLFAYVMFSCVVLLM